MDIKLVISFQPPLQIRKSILKIQFFLKMARKFFSI